MSICLDDLHIRMPLASDAGVNCLKMLGRSSTEPVDCSEMNTGRITAALKGIDVTNSGILKVVPQVTSGVVLLSVG